MMTRRELLVATGWLLMANAFPAFAADPAGDPDAWVLELSNAILDAIRKDKKLAEADPEHVRKFVDELVMPAVDFLRMTRMSVGPKWRNANEQQREELQQLFREQLIRVYSGALSSVKSQVAKLDANRVKPTEKDALVRTKLVEAGKPDIHLHYRLKKVDGRWRIVDVNVEGIWLVDNYRNQFASVVNSKGIEGLIETLRQKNSEVKK